MIVSLLFLSTAQKRPAQFVSQNVRLSMKQKAALFGEL